MNILDNIKLAAKITMFMAGIVIIIFGIIFTVVKVGGALIN